MTDFKICQHCGSVFYRSDIIANKQWSEKRYCSHTCKTRFNRSVRGVTLSPCAHLARPAMDLGDDDERVPELTLAEIERRKAEVRERHLRELVAAGGRFEEDLG